MVVVKEDVYETELYKFETMAAVPFPTMPVYDDGNIRCENKGENMDAEVVEAVVDELFTLLEAAYPDNPILLLVLNSVEGLANNLIPTIVDNLNTKK